ncbi:MAG: hypothetical protein V7785_03400 [Bermanella sp.]
MTSSLFKKTCYAKVASIQWSEFIVMLSFLALTIFSRSHYSDDLSLFFTLMTVCYSLVFGFFIYLWQKGIQISGQYVFLWALIFHMMGVLGSPLFEDDYFRYLWDAYQSIHLGGPYGIAPSNYFYQDELSQSIPHQFQAILDRINYPDIATIYAPGFQYSFLLAYFIAPGEVWALQLIYSAIDMILIAILLKLAKPNMVLLYAWSPLVFKEVILTAHPDGLAVCLLMAAILCLKRQYLYRTAVLLGASVASKIFAIIFVPFLLIQCRPRHWLVFLITLFVLYFPFLNNGESDLLGLSAMANNWEFNSAFYGILVLWFSAVTSKVILAFLLCVFMGGYFLKHLKISLNFNRDTIFNILLIRKKPNIIRGDCLMGIFLLCSPVVNPWYLIWVLPFATIYLNPSAWLASVMIMLAYVVGLNIETVELLGPYDQPTWARVLEFSIIITAILLQIIYQWRKNIRV